MTPVRIATRVALQSRRTIASGPAMTTRRSLATSSLDGRHRLKVERAGAQLLGALSRVNTPRFAGLGAHLGDEHEIFGYGCSAARISSLTLCAP